MRLPLYRIWTFVVVCCILLSSCGIPLFAPPTPTLEPTETAWRRGTPEPLFAPLTHSCPGTGTRPLQFSGVSYGVNVFLFGTDMDRVLTLTNIAGFTWIRQQIHWRDMEGEREQYVWTPLDQAVNAARAYDMNILLSVVRSPTWATNNGQSGLPDDTDAFAAFLRETATRYRGRVSAYEIWNEPNLAHEGGGVPGDPAAYLATLQAAYPAIKQADPCALVLAAPLAATNNADPSVAADDIPFYDQLYALDDGAFLNVADIVAVHPGAGPHHPSEHWPDDAPDQSHAYVRHIERIHDLMQRSGDHREVWITEVGWTVTTAEGAPPPVTEQQQADYLVDTLWYVRQRYPWISGVFVWNLNFSVIAPPGDEKTTFSIIGPDWSIRPAFIAMQNNVPALRDIENPPLVSDGADYRFAWNFPGRGAIQSPPLLNNDAAISVVSNPGTLYTLSLTGTLHWNRDAPGIVSGTPAQAPDGTLVVADSASLLTALHPDDGTEMWSVRLRSPVRGSPVYAAGHIYVVNRIGEVQAFDMAGDEQWKYDLEMATTPLVLSNDGNLLTGRASGEVFKLARDGSVLWRTSVGDGVWAAPVPDAEGGTVIATVSGLVVAIDTDGAIRWRTDVGAPVVAPPLYSHAGHTATVYVADRNGVLTALDASDGAVRWTYASGSDIRATPGQGPDGMLYIGTEDERVLAIAPGGTLRWYAVVRGAVRAPPVVAADGTLYVATMSGRLYAFVR